LDVDVAKILITIPRIVPSRIVAAMHGAPSQRVIRSLTVLLSAPAVCAGGIVASNAGSGIGRPSRHVRRPVPLCQVRAERWTTSGNVADSTRTPRTIDIVSADRPQPTKGRAPESPSG
jgi:hypothetical protein